MIDGRGNDDYFDGNLHSVNVSNHNRYSFYCSDCLEISYCKSNKNKIKMTKKRFNDLELIEKQMSEGKLAPSLVQYRFSEPAIETEEAVKMFWNMFDDNVKFERTKLMWLPLWLYFLKLMGASSRDISNQLNNELSHTKINEYIQIGREMFKFHFGFMYSIWLQFCILDSKGLKYKRKKDL